MTIVNLAGACWWFSVKETNYSLYGLQRSCVICTKPLTCLMLISECSIHKFCKCKKYLLIWTNLLVKGEKCYEISSIWWNQARCFYHGIWRYGYYISKNIKITTADVLVPYGTRSSAVTILISYKCTWYDYSNHGNQGHMVKWSQGV